MARNYRHIQEYCFEHIHTSSIDLGRSSSRFIYYILLNCIFPKYVSGAYNICFPLKAKKFRGLAKQTAKFNIMFNDTSDANGSYFLFRNRNA